MSGAPKHFLSLAELPHGTIEHLVSRADAFCRSRFDEGEKKLLTNKSIAMVFEKPSTRTRVAFEAAAVEMGGAGIYLDARGSQLGRGEPLEDTARVLASYCVAIVYRTFGHERVEKMASASAVPVINGLTDLLHPCQLIADLLTVHQEWGSLAGRRYAWVGDGNNMANSWINAAADLGLELALACPEGYDPDPGTVEAARRRMAKSGRGSIELSRDPRDAARGAHVISTDVFASMGQEAEAQARLKAFEGFCVDEALVSLAAKDAIVLHCLPAHRGEEISGAVLDGQQSRAWRQAANRLHAHKAILEWSLST